MRKFVIKIGVFCIMFLLAYSIIYHLADDILNSEFDKDDAIFVWGDSQAYYGIETKELSIGVGKSVYSSAQPGAGVYDFITFTQRVPDKSNVIIALSQLVQIRRKEMDYNRSGISLAALTSLYRNNYSIEEIYSIVKRNLIPQGHIIDYNSPLPFEDSMRIDLPISHFENYLRNVPSFLKEKQAVYLEGVAFLIKKECTISFIEFPYHPILNEIENRSAIRRHTNDMKAKVASLFQEFEIDSIQLNQEKNIFKDLSHLNINGARDLSNKLGKRIKNKKQTVLFVVR